MAVFVRIDTISPIQISLKKIHIICTRNIQLQSLDLYNINKNEGKQKGMKKMKKSHKEAILLMIPAFAVYTFVVAYPLINMAVTSFCEWNGVFGVGKKFTGWKNYILFFTDPVIGLAIKNILILMAASVIFIVPISLFLASVIHKSFRGLRFVKVSYFLPVIINKVSIGLLFTFIFYPKDGPFVEMIRAFGYEKTVNVLGNVHLAIWGTAFVLIWCNVGFYMILFSSAMATIPEELMEASILDGANARQKFFYVTVPLMRGTIGVAVTLILMNAFKVYDLIVALTGGGPGNATEVLSTYLFKNAFYYSRFGYANAIGVMMVACSMVITVVVHIIQHYLDRK